MILHHQNFQANFWGMYSANRVDLATSFFQPMMDFVPKARRAAGFKNCSALSYAAHIINSMVMQSITRHGVFVGTRYYTTLFPAINRSEAASFTRLRARGAFLITASWDATKQTVVSPVTVVSEAGQEFVLVNPWDNNHSVMVQSNGTVVQMRLQGGQLRFPTQAGRTYEIVAVVV